MKGARILVIDDSATILKVVSAMLARNGFVPQTARDGLMGIELIKRGHAFDLVLLDFVMPRMNGYQFCRELRAHAPSKELPVVLMSAKADKIREQFAHQTGAVHAITKPFDEAELSRAIAIGFAKAKEAAEREASVTHDGVEDTVSERRPRSQAPERDRRLESDVVKRISAAAAVRILRMSPRDRASSADLERAIAEVLASNRLDDARESSPPAPESVAGLKAGEVLSGDLSVVPLAEVMQLLQMQRQTGVLRVKDATRALTLFLRDGLIDLAKLSGGPGELRIGRYFVEQGVASRAQIDEAARRAAASGRLLGDELVESDAVSDAAREEALRMQSSELVYELLRWRSGRFSLSQSVARPSSHGPWGVVRSDRSEDRLAKAAERARLGLGIAGLLLEGFRRLDEWSAMEASIAWDQVVTIDEAAHREHAAGFSRLERRVLESVDGRRTIKQILDESDVGRFDAMKAIQQLLRSRVLRA
jgi:CheY-like chemotaxis protein